MLGDEGNDVGEDQIAMETDSSLSSFPTYRYYLPPPSDFQPSIESSDDDADGDIEDLPTPLRLKSSSELRQSASRTFKVCTIYIIEPIYMCVC